MAGRGDRGMKLYAHSSLSTKTRLPFLHNVGDGGEATGYVASCLAVSHALNPPRAWRSVPLMCGPRLCGTLAISCQNGGEKLPKKSESVCPSHRQLCQVS